MNKEVNDLKAAEAERIRLQKEEEERLATEAANKKGKKGKKKK